MRTTINFTLLLLCFSINAQDSLSILGKYSDYWLANGDAGGTFLELKANGKFVLCDVDYVFPMTFKEYTNEGHWVMQDDQIVLNPHLKRRKPKVIINEKEIAENDSLEIKINYYIESYKNQRRIEKVSSEFDILTLYFNKKRKYINITNPKFDLGSCAFAPRIRRRVNIDSSKTFKIPKRELSKVGIMGYGFIKPIELPIKNMTTNYLEINITIPVDIERMPRNKKVLIKGNRAFIYERNGKVRKSLNPLYKKRQNIKENPTTRIKS